ncbi:MAG: hypothetical protein LBJ93_01800 [Clostridiales bacterium]|jgi:hypothetical protein|nr:hypothetical protein [Clostridiales bacterium]
MCHRDRNKFIIIGMMLFFTGLGMFISLVVPSCEYVLAVIMIILGAWLLFF